MVKIYKQPFAHDGDAIAIPDASQPDGKMSSTDGWTVDYQLPKTDPNYKPVGRQEMNGVFKEVTEALGQVQVQGSATWSADGAPYPIRAQVYHNGRQWLALRANSVEPVEGEDWSAVMGQKDVAVQYSQSLSASGWQKLPSGLITQWGTAVTNSFGYAHILYPVSFNKKFILQGMHTGSGPVVVIEDFATKDNLSQAFLRCWNMQGGALSGWVFYWLAVGV